MGAVDHRLYNTIQQFFTNLFKLLQTCALIVCNVPKIFGAIALMAFLQQKLSV
jgi:hypothetical protein